MNTKMVKFALMASLATATAAGSYAATAWNWTGAGDGANWFTPANWSDGDGNGVNGVLGSSVADCPGDICVGGLAISEYKTTHHTKWRGRRIVMGDDSHGFNHSQGSWIWDSKTLTFGSSADWTYKSPATGGNTGTPGSDAFIAYDTTDCFDKTTPRTITINGDIPSKGSTSGKLAAYGCGTVIYAANAGKVTGGFTASNSVTVAVNSGCRPGS